jgi:hypothetical protein
MVHLGKADLAVADVDFSKLTHLEPSKGHRLSDLKKFGVKKPAPNADYNSSVWGKIERSSSQSFRPKQQKETICGGGHQMRRERRPTNEDAETIAYTFHFMTNKGGRRACSVKVQARSIHDATTFSWQNGPEETSVFHNLREGRGFGSKSKATRRRIVGQARLALAGL